MSLQRGRPNHKEGHTSVRAWFLRSGRTRRGTAFQGRHPVCFPIGAARWEIADKVFHFSPGPVFLASQVPLLVGLTMVDGCFSSWRHNSPYGARCRSRRRTGRRSGRPVIFGHFGSGFPVCNARFPAARMLIYNWIHCPRRWGRRASSPS